MKKERNRRDSKARKLWNWVRHKAGGPPPGPGLRFDLADAKSEWDPILGMPPYTFVNCTLLKGYIPGLGGYLAYVIGVAVT